MPLPQHLCYNCFKEKQTPDGPCPYCGYDHAEHAAKYPTALRAGSILNGQYIVGRVLGQGGFGITYLAFDYQLKIKVAVKEYMPDGMATRLPETALVSVYTGEKQENFEYGAERFLDEARVLAKFLGNKNIAGVKSYFNENNTSYFVMDYIEGISFKSYIQNQGGKIGYSDALRVLVPVLRALSVVHREGFIHRDVTPDNIYITKDGEIKLLDFGSARYSLGDKSKSLDVILKAGYAPKEQYMRRGKQGPYTDVYSAAACFYAAITGYLPPEALERMEEDELVAPSSRGVKLPAYLEDAILKGLEVKAEDRYQSAEEFLLAIEQGQLNETGAPAIQPVLPQQQAQAAVTSGTSQSVAAAQSGAPQPTVMQAPPLQTPPTSLRQQAAVSGGFSHIGAIASPVRQSGAPLPQVSQQKDASVSRTLYDNTGNKKERGLTKSIMKLVGIVAASVAGIVLIAVLITTFTGQNRAASDEPATATTKPFVPASEIGGMPAVSSAPQMPGANGSNAFGNAVNGGLASEADGWVYYQGAFDRLCKMREDGSEQTELNEDESWGICVVNDWVYYHNNTDGITLYRIRTDGSERTKLNEDRSLALNIVDGWVYYRNDSDNSKLYKIRTDGSERTKLCEDEMWEAMCAVDGWAYYNNASDNGYLYKIRLDGTERTRLNKDSSSILTVSDGWIYYPNENDGNKLYKIRTDGSERTKLNEDSSAYINAMDGWVYYCNNSDGGSLYKIRTDGNERTMLNDKNCRYINLAGDWIYYQNMVDFNIWRIRSDGSENQNTSEFMFAAPVSTENGNTTGNYANFGAAVLGDGWIYFANHEDEGKLYRAKNPEDAEKVSDCSPTQLNYSGNWLYFIADGKIYKMCTDGTDQTLLSDDRCEELVLSGGWIYYPNIADGFALYRISLDGTKRQRIHSDWFSDVNVLGDTIYYTNYEDNSICRINTDGSGKEIIYNAGQCFTLNILDDWIYFRNNSENGAICKIRLDGSEFTKLTSDNSSCLNVAGGWIYFRNNSDASTLYKIKTDGTQKSKLNSFDTNTICIAGDWLYYCNNTQETAGWYYIETGAA